MNSSYKIKYQRSSTDARNAILQGKGSLALSEDMMTFEGRKRPSWPFSRSKRTITISREAVFNVVSDGKSISFEYLPDGNEQTGIQAFVFYTAGDEETGQIKQWLPARITPEFEKARAEVEQFKSDIAEARRRAYVTYSLIALNIAAFILTIIAGSGIGTSNTRVLLKYGANFRALTTDGEWWRLLSSAFLHAGIFHLMFNMWALFTFGVLVERLYGNFFFCLIYIFSALTGGLASIIWADAIVSVGASGAIFGVCSALMAFLMTQKGSIPSSMASGLWKSALIFAGYNVVYGFSHAGIDNAAHVGGLIGGFLMGLALSRPLDAERRSRRMWVRLLTGAGVGVAAIVLAVAAVPHTGPYAVKLVKTGHVNDYPQPAIGEAVDAYFGNPEWESGTSAGGETKGKTFVNAKGRIKAMEKDVDVLLQFIVDEKAGTFYVYALEFDKVPQDRAVLIGLLDKMYGKAEPDATNNIAKKTESTGDEANPESIKWNTDEVDAIKNGNIDAAVQLLTSAASGSIISISPSPGMVAKRPLEYCGKMVTIKGEVAVAQDYHPGSNLAKRLGGESSEIILVSEDSTIADFFIIGSAGNIKVGDTVALDGFPVGLVELQNAQGEKKTQLLLVGKLPLQIVPPAEPEQTAKARVSEPTASESQKPPSPVETPPQEANPDVKDTGSGEDMNEKPEAPQTIPDNTAVNSGDTGKSGSNPETPAEKQTVIERRQPGIPPYNAPAAPPDRRARNAVDVMRLLASAGSDQGSAQRPGENGTAAPMGSFKVLSSSRDVNSLAARSCSERTEFKDKNRVVLTCYKDQWADWVTGTARRVSGNRFKSFESDSGVESPADRVIEYPDGSKRLIFGGCRAHACTDAGVYFLLDPQSKEMDIIAWKSRGGAEYLGRNAEQLRSRNVLNLLNKY